MWPVQELLSRSRSAQFYFCMDQKKKACQQDADPATRGLWVVLWSEGKGNCRAYHLPPGLWPRASSAQLLESAQADLVGQDCCSGSQAWGPSVEDGTWRAAVLGPLPEEVTEAPGSGELHPRVPLGLVGSRNNTQMDFFEAGTWKAFFKASGWVSAWVLIISDCFATLLSDNRKNRTSSFCKGVLCSDRMFNVIF